jgi:hypothetical protein
VISENVLANVQTSVNDGRDGANFCAQFLFDTSKSMTIVVRYQIDS